MSVEISLEAVGTAQENVLAYLKENASEALAAKINAGKKTMAGAMDYIKVQARKMASGSGMVMVEDATVYGWAVHYFEEGEIEEEGSPAEAQRRGAAKKEENSGKPVKAAAPAMTEFEKLFGGGN